MMRLLIGVLIIFIGLSALTGISFVKFFIAIILILIGVRIIVGRHYSWHYQTSSSSEDYLNEVLVFSPVNKIITSSNFKGGKIVMVFAGGEIDLRQAKTTEKNLEIKIVTVFGGGRLLVPREWKVTTETAAIIGGFSNQTERKEGEVTLNIKGSAVFGGLEIIN